MSAKIGIIGAGQLGRMLALAGYPLGLHFRFLDHSADTPGGQVGDIVVGKFTDEAQLNELTESVDVMTYEFENVAADVLERIAAKKPFRPPVAALATAQDRLSEKTLFGKLGIATTRFRTVDSRAELESAARDLGLPMVIKTRRLGYDGHGQAVVKDASQLDDVFARLGDVPLIAEEFIHFDKEVSAIAARSPSGEVSMYPLSHNVHKGGILRYSLAPADDADLSKQAQDIIKRLLGHFDYSGILTIEFFVRDGQLIANEIAPRVHNSGHWTIEGAVTSQFENHVRAVLDLPLGASAARGYSAMINFLGTMPEREAVLAIDGAHFHDYGKTPRPGRKLGHCTVTADTEQARDAALAQVLALIPD